VQGSSDPTRELLDAAAFCGHLVEAGSVAGFLAKHRHELFPDELFADLFPSHTGRPSVPAEVVATVMVLQALEGLTDRDAIQQLRTNIAWKVAAGLALDDPGFHATVLTLCATGCGRRTSPSASSRRCGRWSTPLGCWPRVSAERSTRRCWTTR
jgi:hypothetical protein